MRVLVTGGLGFIGSHVVDLLVDSGQDVIVVDALHPLAHADVPRYGRTDTEVCLADVRDLDAMRSSVRGVDAVCHQAAMVGLGADFTDITDFTAHNDVGTAVLLRALHESDFSGPLVLASSMVVYGAGRSRCPEHGDDVPVERRAPDLDAGQFDPRCRLCGAPAAPLPVTEDAPLRPQSVYAATKVHQEHLCTAYTLEHPEVTVTMLRYHNAYGPRMPQQTPYAGVAAIFRSAIERGIAPKVYEDGRQLRDFVHVHDVARANVLALARDTGGLLACNIASGRPHTIGELAAALCHASSLGLQPNVTGEWRAGDVRHVIGATDRADQELGFRAEVGFEQGVHSFAGAALRAAASHH